ncbi:trypsin-like peptidase domain-containing protein [Burkholderia sp. AU19243]|uniref:trypsin-like peptidase domain-containing protein n=1 Tax=Burkholderia TaxID=32008 RepID=UPI001AE86C34|nr:trypsin-like peptidase domain-containing protein [Burkholderia latens]MBR8141714.1 trypsin-like peptidase domain-containing protein [Burkholderia vietnamiensis]MBR8362561.1 trypsin-like peptidase domain-containing protein [Burkholderia sp. AU19243]QTO50739.1 trypsin-like peptidase domain-containing protein [Burkholderia latens]
MVRQTLARAVLRTALIGGVFAVFWSAPPPAVAATAATAAPSAASPVAKERPVAPRYSMPVDFPAIVERYGPAVVTIMTAAPDQQAGGPSFAILDPDDPLAAFFRRGAPLPTMQSSPAPAPDTSPRAIAGSGSGFIVSADGLILTSAHVVADATDVTVRLADRRDLKATVLAVDPQSDVAVLHVDATRLPVVRIGDSSRVRAGEPVMTLGAPDGSGNTVTAGIVSATAHALPDGSAFPFFQTDIAVNPDNSGGPVFNRAGDVIGIAMQVYTGAERYASTTFAIPIALAMKVRAQAQAQMRANAQAQRASSGNVLGVDVQDVGAGLAAAFGLRRPAGALVNGVDPGSPAAAAGVKAGDVIVKFGDRPIGRSAELNDLAAALPAGAKAPLRLIRNRTPMVLTVTGAGTGDATGDAIDNAAVAGAAGGIGSVDGVGAAGAVGNAAAAGVAMAATRPVDTGDRLGLTMHALSDTERRSTGLAVGMMVDAVHGPAAKAGIRPGDVVLELNDTLLETPDDVPMLEAKGGVIAVLIQRDNARKFVSVRAR